MTIFTGKKNLSTATVYLTIITSILGVVLFLRLGYSVGILGLMGTLGLIIVAHMVVIPSALAISEISTNQRIEGESEYDVLSRSFGLNIGAVIGIALYLCQTIGIAFFVISITEALTPLLHFIRMDGIWGRPIISLLVFYLLSYLSYRKNNLLSINTLLTIFLTLLVALIFFFMGNSVTPELIEKDFLTFRTGNISDSFYNVFSLIFPAFAGILYGLRLIGQVRKREDTIPKGIMVAVITGAVIFCLISLKLARSAIDSDLVNDPLIMGKISSGGPVIIPLVIVATAFFAAMISIVSAPATLFSLASDNSLPVRKLNTFFSKSRKKTNVSSNAIYFTNFIAFFFVLKGEFDFMAQILTMLYLLVFGSICLVSFLNDFGANPAYRPLFRSRWYISIIGFITSVWIIFEIHLFYAFVSIILVVLVYKIVSSAHPDRGNFAVLFRSAVFRLNRNIQLYLQKRDNEKIWRPSVVCLTSDTFENDHALKLLNWISFRYGFGTYFHHIEDHFTNISNENAKEILYKLKETAGENNSVYLNTLISPTFNSAISQVVQQPVMPGTSNNMIVLAHSRKQGNINKLTDSLNLAGAANLDVCILIPAIQNLIYSRGLHVWLKADEVENNILLINLSYIIMAHPDWRSAKIKFFYLSQNENHESERKKLTELAKKGILTLSVNNIEIINYEENTDVYGLINERSKDAGLTFIGFKKEEIIYNKNIFDSSNIGGCLLFVNAKDLKENI